MAWLGSSEFLGTVWVGIHTGVTLKFFQILDRKWLSYL